MRLTGSQGQWNQVYTGRPYWRVGEADIPVGDVLEVREAWRMGSNIFLLSFWSFQLAKHLGWKQIWASQGFWQMNKLAFWYSYFTLKFQKHSWIHPEPEVPNGNLSAASQPSVQCFSISRYSHLPSQQIKFPAIGRLKYQAPQYIIFPFAVTWDRQLLSHPKGFFLLQLYNRFPGIFVPKCRLKSAC